MADLILEIQVPRPSSLSLLYNALGNYPTTTLQVKSSDSNGYVLVLGLTR